MELLQCSPRQHIVGIDEHEIGTRCRFETTVAADADAPVLLVFEQLHDLRVFPGKISATLQAAIAGTILDQQDLIRPRKRLVDQAVEAFVQERLDIVDRHDHRNLNSLCRRILAAGHCRANFRQDFDAVCETT